MNNKHRKVSDSMGEMLIPDNALYGAQTQRAIENFPVSDLTLPRRFIEALGMIKAAAAQSNLKLNLLDEKKARAIESAAEEVISGTVDAHFPIDVFQTGSGTSINMNANEVIAEIASRKLGSPIHPNDDVNKSQSSNDVIPTAIHVSASLGLHVKLLPALKHLYEALIKRADELKNVTKTGRTHLMDAMPVTFGQEIGGWAAQIQDNMQRIEAILPSIQALAIGGTAVGTGINAHPHFAKEIIAYLVKLTNISFKQSHNLFASMGSQDAAVAVSGQLKTTAVSLMKIANDLRWMNSGPLAGLSEITLPALQPGSSIMPGKINPVVPEAVTMVCAQVMGNDTTITIAGQSGNFQLNVMLPVIAYNLLQSIDILSNASILLADKAISGFIVNEAHIQEQLAKNPILITALNTVIGYELGAKIAKEAYKTKRPVLDVAKEMTNLSEAELKKILDPNKLTHGGIPKS